MKILGTTALVTGANRGLGRALTEALLERGARRVYATSRNLASLDALAASAPDRIVPLVLDVTIPEQIERAAERAASVQLVINNAGLLASYGVLSGSPSEVRRDVETNFFGLLNVARAFTPVLEKNRPSALVSILSVASLASMPAIGGYSTSKAAAWSLTQALRAELLPRNVAVHAVFPGPVDTDMIRAFDMAKTPPAAVARAIIDGVESGSLDIFPDGMSSDIGALFATDPASVARRFAEPSSP